ncbi:MAG: 50S ribosomal protein L29 [Desulfurococcales archaeon]|nr:50S ribosomal protein L29 [Desulfurococcales archaeon]
MSADEIRKMSPEDRRKLLQELRLELIKLRAQASMGTLDKPHKIKLTKKNIARILTVEREEMFRGEVGEERKR